MSNGLPPRWTWRTVDELASLVEYGTSAKTNESSGGVAVIRMGNITDGKLKVDSLKYLPARHAEFPKLLLEPGDVLFNRTNSAELVGKSAVYKGVPAPCSYASYLIRVRLRTGCLPDYLAYFINSGFGRTWIKSVVSQQVGQANVNGSKLRALCVPAAPLKEQRRIVDAIEQHFSDIDAGVTSLKRVLANVKRYRASVLKAACEGRLVPTEAALAKKEMRDYEPANVLLQRILGERRSRWEAGQLAKMKAKGQEARDDRWKAKYQETSIPERGALPGLPKGWCWGRLGTISEVQLGQQRAPIHAAAEKPYPYVRAANITWKGLDLTDVNHMGFPNPARYRLEPGDVLLAEASGSPSEVGKPAIWRGEIPGACYQKTLLRVRSLSMDLSPEWLHLGFLRDAVSGRFAKMAPGVGIVHLTAERMLEWPIALPPRVEQNRIVIEVARILSLTDDLERAARTQLARAARLRQSVLKRAFEGKLVPQDQSDEPASALLEDVRSQQHVVPPLKPRLTKRSEIASKEVR